MTSACSAKRDAVQVAFAATWQGQPISCDTAPVALSDLRFYVSDLALLDSKGEAHPVELTDDGLWQQSNVALIDLETGVASCMNGTPGLHAMIEGLAGTADFAGLRFTVGVPFELNHANPLLADAPLDDAAMHWHWRSGYKFLRAGVTAAEDGTWLHLGSTGCEGTIQDIRECTSPNRVIVSLPDFMPGDRVAIDLSSLFAGVDLDDGSRSDCSSSPAEGACQAVFEALGLPFGDRPGAVTSVFQVLE